jgi:predicted acylesterase/phospholipase RssA
VRRSLDAASRPRSVVVRTITVLKGSESVALGGFLSDLVTELRRLGDVMHVSEALVNAELGEGATRMADYSSKAQIMRWLAEKEETHRLIVFEADAANALWARMCVKSADRVLVVCSSADAPVVPALEYELLWSAQARNNLAHRELVLLHAAGTALPSRTLQWLQARDVEFHHHVRLGHAPHYARLARQLVGQTLGLVLSGGGARGLAHLGAIRAMEERGIAVDYVGGTSQGAFMAAVFAINETYEASAVATRRLATRMGNMWDLLGDATLPVMAYFSGKSLNKTIREILGAETQVEDLWVPFFCVSTNLSCADMYVHTRGPLWRAVRASMSILDYLPPVHDGKDLLCDGGYLANLPADVMRDQFHPQQIIAVDVENKDGDMITNVTDFGDHLSGFWLLAKKIWHSLSPCASKFNIPRFAELISALVSPVRRGADRLSSIASLARALSRSLRRHPQSDSSRARARRTTSTTIAPSAPSPNPS